MYGQIGWRWRQKRCLVAVIEQCSHRRRRRGRWQSVATCLRLWLFFSKCRLQLRQQLFRVHKDFRDFVGVPSRGFVGICQQPFDGRHFVTSGLRGLRSLVSSFARDPREPEGFGKDRVRCRENGWVRNGEQVLVTALVVALGTV